MCIKSIVIIIFLSIINLTFSQSIMTIGEVFDFDIGDVFQYKSELQDQTDNALTKLIVEKYYSSNNDTLFYKIARNYYTSMPVMYPQPHLEYTYKKDTIIDFYANLNSSIFDYYEHLRYDSLLLNYENNFEYDSIATFSYEQCNYLVNGFNSRIRINDVEPNTYNYLFGKGLGLVKVYIVDGHHYGYPSENNRLTYFKKNNTICGFYDITSIKNNNIIDNILIYPNPSKSFVYLSISDIIYNNVQIEIYDISNKLLMSKFVDNSIISLDFSNISKGLYYIKLITTNEVVVKKVIKE